MKDVMEDFTATKRALRISKTSAKEWTLYGALDQALKTSVQASAVRAISMTPTVHDTVIPCTLWISADPPTEEGEPPNLNAMVIVQVQKLRDQGEQPGQVVGTEEGLSFGMVSLSIADLTPVAGPAILTGPGGDNLPCEVAPTCLISALLGSPE